MPVFNDELKIAVIETEGGTFIYEKDITARWTFKDRGLILPTTHKYKSCRQGLDLILRWSCRHAYFNVASN